MLKRENISFSHPSHWTCVVSFYCLGLTLSFGRQILVANYVEVATRLFRGLKVSQLLLNLAWQSLCEAGMAELAN